MTEVVRSAMRGHALEITIDRPERRNAINEEVCAGIAAAIEAAESNPDVRAIVLTGAGEQAFCAGGDLKPNADGAPFTMEPHEPNHFVVKLFRRMQQCRLPIVARINGAAMAGGTSTRPFGSSSR